MKVVYSPKFDGQAKDWSANKLIERKPRFQHTFTVDEYGNQVIKKIRVIKRK